MTLAMANPGRAAGVSIAVINLKFIWDVVSNAKVGRDGRASVVDAQGRLIAHPDISLVLRNLDLSRTPQVLAARSGAPATVTLGRDVEGRDVLTLAAPIAPLGWLVFVDIPTDEAYAPLYASMARSALLLAAALVLAFVAALALARRMVVPIQALGAGAARIGSGDLGQRISIRTGDELEALGEQFNRMAAQLQESYATLEGKVEKRTQELALANLAKSRFLAAASHDLRQPLHALGLFVAQLRGETDALERTRLIGRIDAALAAMNELFSELLDISRLDAGTLAPRLSDFPVGQLFGRLENAFAGPAEEKGLSFRIVPSRAWVCSDFIL
jgi:signal transduction histidine kinase